MVHETLQKKMKSEKIMQWQSIKFPPMVMVIS
jgi:hypothetical protein